MPPKPKPSYGIEAPPLRMGRGKKKGPPKPGGGPIPAPKKGPPKPGGGPIRRTSSR